MLHKMKEGTAHPFPEQCIGHMYPESEMCVSCPKSLGIHVVTVYTGQTQLEIEHLNALSHA